MSSTITPSKASLNRVEVTEASTPPILWPIFLQETIALTRRLFIQLQRRPSTLIAGIVQPLMWLILFGALFQNAPQGLFGDDVRYGQFWEQG